MVLTISASTQHRMTVLVRTSRQERREGTCDKREQIILFAANTVLAVENHEDTNEGM